LRLVLILSFSPNNLTLVSVSGFKNLDPGSGLVMVLKKYQESIWIPNLVPNNQTQFQFGFD
jgi:hypothetical protein